MYRAPVLLQDALCCVGVEILSQCIFINYGSVVCRFEYARRYPGLDPNVSRGANIRT